MHDKKWPNHKEKERSYSRRLYTRSSKEKSKESDGNFKIKYINSQGLTKTKMIELEQLCKGKNELVLLSETHMKYNKININEKYSVINKMRSNDDKKGGGLQAFYRRDASFKMIEVENYNNDIVSGGANIAHFFSIGIAKVLNIALGSPICTTILVYPYFMCRHTKKFCLYEF